MIYIKYKNICLYKNNSEYKIIFYTKNKSNFINGFNYHNGFEKSIEIDIKEEKFPFKNLNNQKNIWLAYPNRFNYEDGWFDHHSLFWHISNNQKEFPDVNTIILPKYNQSSQYEWKTSLWYIILRNFDKIPYTITNNDLQEQFGDINLVCFNTLYHIGRMMIEGEGGYIYNYEEGKKLRESIMEFYNVKYSNVPEKLKIIIVQEDVTSKFINFDALVRLINALKVFEIYPKFTFNNETLEEQIKAFSQADIIYIPHNIPYPALIYIPDNTFVIEALPYLFHWIKTSIPTIILNLGYSVNFSNKKPNDTYIPPDCPFDIDENPICEYQLYNMELWINLDYAEFSLRQALAYIEFNKYQKYDWDICGDYDMNCEFNSDDFKESGLLYGDDLDDD